MNINRFKQIIEYSAVNRQDMLSRVKDYYMRIGMDSDRELLNLMQVARPLLEKNGYIIIELPFADKEIGALCYKGDSVKYMFLNTTLPKVNVNFALCHEIYHVFYQKTDFKKKVELLNEHYYEDEEEFAANLFAGMLLMPENSYKLMFNKFKKEEKENVNNRSVLVRLMSYFEVPYMAALIRAYELNLLDSGKVLEELIMVDSDTIADDFYRLWLDDTILKSTKKDDYQKFEEYVIGIGKQYMKEEYLNERTIEQVLRNMRTLYNKIKGE